MWLEDSLGIISNLHVMLVQVRIRIELKGE
jgi:hypothetical protein